MRSGFPPPHVVNPSGEHRQTVILLHGRGSTGPEFQEDLFESQSSSGLTLPEHFPNTKWVFPTSESRHAAVFDEAMTQWYDIYSLTDTGTRFDMQEEGLRSSLEYILELIRDEASKSPTGQVILGGMSQGGSISLLAMLLESQHLSAVLATSTWLPMCTYIENALNKLSGTPVWNHNCSQIIADRLQLQITKEESSRRPPILLGHCVDDDVVPISHQQDTYDLLSRCGMDVTRHAYSDGGHWFNEPQGVQDIVAFLGKVFENPKQT